MSNTSITVAPYRLEKNDWLTLTAKRLTLAYRFGNYGYIDGFDFRTACAHKLGVQRRHGGRQAADRPDLDRTRRQAPAQNPFAILRTR